jgi:hypothetical protein
MELENFYIWVTAVPAEKDDIYMGSQPSRGEIKEETVDNITVYRRAL